MCILRWPSTTRFGPHTPPVPRGFGSGTRHDDAVDVRAERSADAQARLEHAVDRVPQPHRHRGRLAGVARIPAGDGSSRRAATSASRVVASRRASCARCVSCGGGIALLEINVRPGLTNRLLALLVDEVWTSDEASAAYFGRKARRTGTPMRACPRAASTRIAPRLDLGLAPERTTILVFGGSQVRALDQRGRRRAGDPPHARRGPAASPARQRRAGLRLHAGRGAWRPAPITCCSFSVSRRPGRCGMRPPTSRSRAPAHRHWPNWRRPASPAILVPHPFGRADDHQTSNASGLRRSAAPPSSCPTPSSTPTGLWWTLDAVLRPERLADDARCRDLAACARRRAHNREPHRSSDPGTGRRIRGSER